MPANESTIQFIFQNGFLVKVFDIGFSAFALMYFIFSLMVIRQVYAMTVTVETEAGPVLRLLAFVHAAAALIILVMFIFFI